MSKTMQNNNFMERIRVLLDDNRPADALEAVNNSGQKSALMENARGVCLMRLGKTEQAVKVLQEVVFPQGNICVPPGIPVIYQTNFATAMLMINNVESAISILNQLDDRQHPAVAKLSVAIKRWEKNIGLVGRLLCLLGIYPNKSVVLDFPPGEI
jgi:hypothetical protein